MLSQRHKSKVVSELGAQSWRQRDMETETAPGGISLARLRDPLPEPCKAELDPNCSTQTHYNTQTRTPESTAAQVTLHSIELAICPSVCVRA